MWADDTWLQKHAGATLEETEKADTEDNEKDGNSQVQVRFYFYSIFFYIGLCLFIWLSDFIECEDWLV